MNLPEPTLSCAALLKEAEDIRNRAEIQRAMLAMTTQHEKNNILKNLPMAITSIITRQDDFISLSHIASELFRIRGRSFSKYETFITEVIPRLRRDLYTDEQINREKYVQQGRLAEAKIVHEILQEAYLRVANDAGCDNQLRILFQKLDEQQKTQFAGSVYASPQK